MFDIKKYGLKNRGTDNIDSSGASFMHYGPSGDPKMRDNIYNDHESGDIWSKDGSYIGSISMEDGLKNAEFQRVHKEIAGDDNEFNSHNDVAAVVQHLYGDKQSKENTNPSWNEAEFSPQIQSAIERSQSYRDRLISGETSNSIYGRSKTVGRDTSSAGTEASGAMKASDSSTEKYFNSSKYEQDYSAGYE